MRQEYALAGLFVGLTLLAVVTAISLLLSLRDQSFTPVYEFAVTVTQPQVAQANPSMPVVAYLA